jgi:TP901 family phage tail tape measure protein
MAKNTTTWEFNTKDLLGPAITKVMGSMEKLKAITGSVEARYVAGMTNMTQGVKKWGAAQKEAIDSAMNDIPGLNSALDLLKNPYALATAAAIAFTAAAGYAFNESGKWEAQMGKINVTAGMSQDELSGLDSKIRLIARNSKIELARVPDAFNRIISAVGDADKSLAILTPTIKAAQATFTDTNTVAAAAVNILGSVKDKTPNQVFDTLIATLKKGNVEFQDIANYLPKILPFSNNLGTSLEETAGAFALFTARGFSAEASTTGLQNAFRALSDGKTQKALHSIGVEVFDGSNKVRHMTDIVADLSQQLTGLSDKERIAKLGGLGLTAEAQSAFAVLAANANDLKGFISETTNSMGSLDKAVEDSKNTFADWQGVKNKVMIDFIMPLGDMTLKAVGKIIGVIDWLVEYVPKIPAAIKHAMDIATPYLQVGGAAVLGYTATWAIMNASMIATQVITHASTAAFAIKTAAINGLSLATGLYTKVQWLLNAALTANPIGMVVAAIAALGAGFYVAYQRSETFRAGVAGIYEVFKELVPLIFTGYKLLSQLFSLNFTGFKDTVVDAVTRVTSIPDTFKKGFDQSIKDERVDRAKEIIEERKLKLNWTGDNLPAMPNMPGAGMSNAALSAGLTGAASGAGGSGSDSSPDKSLPSISGEGKGGKSITIRIEKMVGIENLNSSVTEALPDIEKAIFDVLMKVTNQVSATAQ